MPVLNGGSKYVTHAVALSTTNDTDCYVVPKNFSSHVEHVFVSNNDNSSRNFTLKFYEKETDSTHTLFNGHAVDGKNKEAIFTVDAPLYLHAEDKLIFAAGTVDTLTVVVSAEEFFEPHR